MGNDEDAALVAACRGGDRGAFDRLVHRYEGPVFNISARMLDSREDARDVTQTVFLKAFENLDRYDPEFRFFSWIYRIAINESINVLNRRARFEPMHQEPASEDDGPAARLDEAGRRDGLLRALAALQPDHRAVIVLKHLQGMSYREISATLEIPEKTVKSRLYSARQDLRERLLGKVSPA